ncbi:MAG: plastocyanin [Burkholderiales bacterium]|nr:plastocyanin [Burkholderiales bacterium]
MPLAPLAPLVAVLLACGMVSGPAAQAATLHVTVTSADGRPAADAVVLVQPAPGAQAVIPAPGTVAIEQRDFRFVPYVTVLAPGGAVRFVNKDPYDHHIRTLAGGPLGNVAPIKTFEFRLAAGGRSGDTSEPVKLDLPGSILLGCHLHGSMRGHVLVSATPWFAVTDERGRARVEGLPEGAVEMKVWHPDQLTEQPVQRLQLGPSLGTDVKLNFTPRRRPAPRPADPSYGPPGATN